MVAGWLTHERATGVVACSAEDGCVQLAARSEYGRLEVAAGSELPGEVLAIGVFADANQGLEAWASEVARRLGIMQGMPTVIQGGLH